MACTSSGCCTSATLHVGDFGAWPDPHRIDKATRKHDGAGDFPAWWSKRREAPRRMMCNLEDFVWLDAQPGPEVLPNLFYLRNGATFDLGGIVVGGLGGCHGPSNYERRSKDLQGYAKRHYTREDITRGRTSTRCAAASGSTCSSRTTRPGACCCFRL